jgi:hypothetical protein
MRHTVCAAGSTRMARSEPAGATKALPDAQGAITLFI